MRSITVSMIKFMNELCMHAHYKDSAKNEYCADDVGDNLFLDKITNKQTSVLNYSKGNSEHKL